MIVAADLAVLSDKPFALLGAIDARLRAARPDLVADRGGQRWTGIALRVRARWFLIPRTEVREILLRPRLTRVPGAKPFLIGVANLRGALLPVTDLGVLWGEEAIPEHHRQRVLVLNSRHIPAGFLVDEVGGYRHFAPGDQHHERTAEIGVPGDSLLGAFARDGQTWPVLSLHRIVRSDAFVKAGG